MNETTVMMTIIGVETAVLICLALVMRLVTWPLYISARNESRECLERTEALMRGKEGWREVAERLERLLELSTVVGRKATKLVAEVGKLDETD